MMPSRLFLSLVLLLCGHIHINVVLADAPVVEESAQSKDNDTTRTAINETPVDDSKKKMLEEASSEYDTAKEEDDAEEEDDFVVVEEDSTKGEEASMNTEEPVTKERPLRLINLRKLDSCTKRSGEDDFIKWNYQGTFLNGTVFGAGQFTAVLGHGHVIPGVDKGMRGLCAGEKRRMIIHPDLAYGAEGRPPKIPPNATLIFDVGVSKVEATGGVSDRNKLKLEWVEIGNNCTASKIAKVGDYIEWNYLLFLLNGTLLEQGNSSCTIGRNEVIYGLEEGVLGTCVGDKRKITIHPDWAYGWKGTDRIPGGKTLIYIIHPMKVVKGGKHEEL